MSDNKKYYYLKLKENFFDSEEIKLLEKQPNGIIYSNLYLKLCLLSLKGEGKLLFMNEIPYDEKMISDITGIELDNVRAGIVILQKFKLLKRIDSGEIWLTNIQTLIGHSSTEAERKAEYRRKIYKNEHKKLIQDNVPQLSQKRPPELEIEIKTEIDINIELQKFFIKQFYDKYKVIHNQEFKFTPKEIGNIRNLLKYIKTKEEIERVINNAFADKFWRDKLTPTIIYTNLNKFSLITNNQTRSKITDEWANFGNPV